MSNPLAPLPVPVTLVHSAACHFCDDARSALDALTLDFALDVTEVDLESAEGVWANGTWDDFDPTQPPNLLDADPVTR